MNRVIHVVAGVIRNSRGEVLLAKRPDHVHQGGLWEFPGGKVEAGENIERALARELEEELAIQVERCRPLICIRHDYSDKSVLLDVWEVSAFSGEPVGNEGQPVRWVAREKLRDYAFPAANTPIVAAARLPDRLLVTGGVATDAEFVSRLSRAIENGVSLVQLRAPELDENAYRKLFDVAYPVCRDAGVGLIANTSPEIFSRLEGQGLHINSRELERLDRRPVPEDIWFSASCHSPGQIEKAALLQADFITLSPVLPTATHPDARAVGWEVFAQWVAQAKMPVYALGGMSEKDIANARIHGAQGIAAIRAFWSTSQGETELFRPKPNPPLHEDGGFPARPTETTSTR